jgi:hypothetical protein
MLREPNTATGDAPLRRTLTLAHDFPQATTKQHFEQCRIQFLRKCCLKNTQREAVLDPLLIIFVEMPTGLLFGLENPNLD